MQIGDNQLVGLEKLPGLAGLVIIIGGLALGYKVSEEASGELAFWRFLQTALNPVALGLLIMVAGNIASKLGNRDN